MAKPIYKRVWFWVIIVVLMFGVLGSCSDDKENGREKVGTEKTEQKEETKSKTEYYKVGDVVKVGDVPYTLKSVTATSERNEFEDSKPNYVIKIVYHAKNNLIKNKVQYW